MPIHHTPSTTNERDAGINRKQAFPSITPQRYPPSFRPSQQARKAEEDEAEPHPLILRQYYIAKRPTKEAWLYHHHNPFQ
jgi:hypothetical protein